MLSTGRLKLKPEHHAGYVSDNTNQKLRATLFNGARRSDTFIYRHTYFIHPKRAFKNKELASFYIFNSRIHNREIVLTVYYLWI